MNWGIRALKGFYSEEYNNGVRLANSGLNDALERVSFLSVLRMPSGKDNRDLYALDDFLNGFYTTLVEDLKKQLEYSRQETNAALKRKTEAEAALYEYKNRKTRAKRNKPPVKKNRRRS